ncbi:MAG TPA: hypothetical protein VMW13_08450 [Dehalococcoidales bacterium]|nr:hypothetical protein [Dehalococcoidales bacterium]
MEVEWLILADSAQVVGNKVYLLGGGWDRLTVNTQFPANQRCAVALSMIVPWNETNQKHSFEVEIAADDPTTEEPKSVVKAGGQFEAGRPPGIPPGQDQRIQLAIDMNLKIETAGTKVIIARIDGQEMRRTHFNVVPGPRLSPKEQSV